MVKSPTLLSCEHYYNYLILYVSFLEFPIFILPLKEKNAPRKEK